MKDVSKKRSSFLRSREGLYFFIGLLILSLNLLLLKVAYSQDDFYEGDLSGGEGMSSDYPPVDYSEGAPSFEDSESSMMDPVTQYDDDLQGGYDEDLIEDPGFPRSNDDFESPASPRFEGDLPSLDNGDSDSMDVVGGSAPLYE